MTGTVTTIGWDCPCHIGVIDIARNASVLVSSESLLARGNSGVAMVVGHLVRK